MSNKDKAKVEVVSREDELKSLLNCCLLEWTASLGLLEHLIEMDKKYNGGVKNFSKFLLVFLSLLCRPCFLIRYQELGRD